MSHENNKKDSIENNNDLSWGDVEEIIKKKKNSTNFKLVNYSFKPVSERVGLLGDHSFLNATVIEADPRTKKSVSLFIKLFPKAETLAAFAEGIGAFAKEEFVYELLSTFKESGIDLVTQCTPNCYLIRQDKYLVLDDLLDEGFRPLNKQEFLDYNHVLTILLALSQLHASSLIYEEKKSLELGSQYRLLDEFEENFEESFFSDRDGFCNEKGVEASIRCVVKEIDIFQFPDTLPSGKRFSSIAKELCYEIFDLVKPSKKRRNVLCHGDLWATNFLVSYKNNFPVRCKFVDFQCGRYVPPAHDVMSLLYLTTSKEFREKYMYEVVGIYYSYLEKQLKNAGFDLNAVIPFGDFLESCEEQKVFAIVQTAIYFPLILIDNGVIEEYLFDEELNKQALYEDKTYLVLKHMDDQSYAERLKDSINNLREYCNHK